MRSEHTNENTMENDDGAVEPDLNHRHYDEISERAPVGQRFPSCIKGLDVLQRRKQGRLAVNRIPFLEPLAAQRESYYEQKLLLGLPWHCGEDQPVKLPCGKLEWHLQSLTSEVVLELVLSPDTAVSFEDECKRIEHLICQVPYIVCKCCTADHDDRKCKRCLHAVSFHTCENCPESRLWRKGSLYGEHADYQRMIFNMHRKGLPTHALRAKADEYVDAGHIDSGGAELIVRTIEGERGKERMANEGVSDHVEPGDGKQRISDRLSYTEMKAELEKREGMMQEGPVGEGVPDQWRVYQYLTGEIEAGRFLRLMVQASAGTGTRGGIYVCSDAI